MAFLLWDVEVDEEKVTQYIISQCAVGLHTSVIDNRPQNYVCHAGPAVDIDSCMQ